MLDRVLDQFGRILILPAERSGAPRPAQLIDRLSWATVPRATAVSGVRQSELVTFLFEPTDPNAGLQPADMPTSVTGVKVATGFRTLRPPAAPAAPDGSGNPDFAWNKVACAELTDMAQRFVVEEQVISEQRMD